MGAAPEHDALFWEDTGDSARCSLCPRRCTLKEGRTGECRNRTVRNGRMITLGYGQPCAVHIDPIEKKPLYHVYPGTNSFSIAVAGCNMRCLYCQNHTISQASPLHTPNYDLAPESVVAQALANGCDSIAFTYSEPTVWYEYMFDTAKLAHAAGLKNCMITCGYINPDPLKKLAPFLDAANIDLKSFSDDIYKRLNSGALQPVLDTITLSRSLGIWVELTNLVVPGWNDDMVMIRNMCAWIKNTIGTGVPLHFSRFSPLYKLAHLYPTPLNTLLAAKKVAQDVGIDFVYIGNVAGTDSNTYCPHCRAQVVGRRGYLITDLKIAGGKCGSCGHAVSGVWKG
jgi:pyruvate formate lyase activating enzyme